MKSIDRRQCCVCGEESVGKFVEERLNSDFRFRVHVLHEFKAKNDECRKALEHDLVDENIRKRMLEVEKKSQELHNMQMMIERQEEDLRKKESVVNSFRGVASRYEELHQECRTILDGNQVKPLLIQDTHRLLSHSALSLQKIRYRKALEQFRLMHLRVDLPSSRTHITGVGSIMNLPLLNSGSMLSTPIDALCSAIFFIAQLVDALAVVLDIPLPYSLDLYGKEEGPDDDIYPMAIVQGNPCSLLPAVPSRRNMREFDWTPLELVGGEWGEDRSLFPLHANIVALCISAGVAQQAMFPPACMLCNLEVLRMRISEELEKIAGIIEEEGVSEKYVDSDVFKRVRNALLARFPLPKSLQDRGGLHVTIHAGQNGEGDWAVVDDDYGSARSP
eukprot:gene29406-35495_t